MTRRNRQLRDGCQVVMLTAASRALAVGPEHPRDGTSEAHKQLMTQAAGLVRGEHASVGQQLLSER